MRLVFVFLVCLLLVLPVQAQESLPEDDNNGWQFSEPLVAVDCNYDNQELRIIAATQYTVYHYYSDGTGQPWRASSNFDANVTELVFRTDPTSFLVGYDNSEVNIWTRTATSLEAETTRYIWAHTDDADITALATYDDLVLTGTAVGDAQLWQINDEFIEPVRYFNEPLQDGERRMPVTAVAFSPDGEYVAISRSNGQMYLWDVDGRISLNAPLHRFDYSLQSESPTTSLAFSLDGDSLMLVGLTGVVSWHIDFNDRSQIAHETGTAEGSITSIVALENDRVLIGTESGEVEIWTRGDYTHVTSLLDTEGTPIEDVASCGEELYIAASGTMLFRLQES